MGDDTEYSVVLSAVQIEWLLRLVRGLPAVVPGSDGDGIARALELAEEVE